MNLILIIIVAVAAVLGQEALYERLWSRRLTAVLEFSAEALEEGQRGTLKEVIRNEKLLPIPALHVKWVVGRNLRFDAKENTAMTDQVYRNDVFSLMPYQQITRTLEFTAVKRGHYLGKELDLVSHDLFFSTSYSKSVPSQAELYVYPGPVDPIRLEPVFDAVLGSYRASRRLYEDAFALRGMREYEPWDPMNRINWKATARTGTMMVNEYEYAGSRRTVILLNVEPDSVWPRQELQEESIRLCGALIRRFSGEEIPAMVLTGEETELPECSVGPAHVRRILERLSCLETEGKRPRFGEFLRDFEEQLTDAGTGGGEPFFVLISTSQSAELQEAYREFARRSPGSLWIAPLYQEDEFSLPGCPEAEPVRWNVRRG